MELLSEVDKVDPKWGERIKKRMESLVPGVVVNQVRSKEDRELGLQIRMIGKRYFGLELPFLGAVEFDDCVWQSVRHKKPVILDYPHSRPSRSIRQVTEAMLSLSRRRT